MGMTSTTQITETISELKEARLRALSNWHLKRLDCLLLVKTYPTMRLDDVASEVGVSSSSLDKWLKRYRIDGLDGLLSRRNYHRDPDCITKEIHQGLATRLNDPHNPFAGYWDAQQWIEDQYGVKIGYSCLYKHMTTKLGSKMKAPRKSNVKKDKEAEKAFLKTTKHLRTD